MTRRPSSPLSPSIDPVRARHTRRSVLTLLLLAVGLLTLWTVRPALAQEAAFTLKLASVAPSETPWATGLEAFKASVEAKSAGKIKVRAFLNGVQGDENETVDKCYKGQLQGVGASTGSIASIVPELSVLELPYLFRSATEADHILDKVITPTVEKAFAGKGLVLGFWSENGFRSFGTSFGAIRTPADLKGRKMRAQENNVHLEMYRAFGASPVPIPVTEVLTSLQTGVVEGYDNTPLFSQAAQWTGATKFYSLTQHIYQPAAIVFNKAWFDSLPADLRALVLAEGRALVPGMRSQIRAMDPFLLQNMTAMRIQVYTPTAAEKASFDAPAKQARDNYLAKATAGEKALYKQITDGLAAYRAAGGK